MKKVITPMTITAADSNSRTITGRIVTFEETGNASIGKVQFAAGSIEPTAVLLNLELATGTDNLRLTCVTRQGRSGNLVDEGWETISRTATYGVLYDEYAA